MEQQQQRQQQQQQHRQQTGYSAVDRRRPAAVGAHTHTRRAHRPRPVDPSTSPKLRYLDDLDGAEAEEVEEENLPDYLENASAEEPAKVMFEKCAAPTTSTVASKSSRRNREHRFQRPTTGFNSKSKQEELETSNTAGGDDGDDDDVEVRAFERLARGQQQQQQQHRQQRTSEEEQEEEETRASLEEVYLCSCCGVTRPLNPAMKYMAHFRGAFLLFNFLVFAFNFANLALGLWFRIDPKVYEIHKYIETQNFTYAGWILLAGGLLGCLLALVGFAAAGSRQRQSTCLLISYALTMTLLTVALIGALVLLTVYGLGPPLERFMNKEIYEQMRRRSMSSPESGLVLPNQNDPAQFLDFVQVKLRCCGAQDWRDYNKLGLNVPTTCFTYRGNMIDAPGCGRALRELFDVRAGLAAGSTAASVVVQLLATLLASLMVCSIYNYRARPRPASSASYAAPTGAGRHTSPSPSPSPSPPPPTLTSRPRQLAV